MNENDLKQIAALLVVQTEETKKLIQSNNEQLAELIQQSESRLIQRISKLEEKVADVQESINEVRGSTNQLLEWAEDASVQVQIPLFKKAE